MTVIVEINGHATRGLIHEDVMSLLRGDSSTLKLDLRRDGRPMSMEVPMDAWDESAVVSRHFSAGERKLGYVGIRLFTSESGALTRKAIESLSALGVERCILDLRNNPGGYLDAMAVAGSVLTEQDTRMEGSTRWNERADSFGGNALQGQRIVILINEGTASAAEVLAAGLCDSIGSRDHNSRTVVEGGISLDLTASLSLFCDQTDIEVHTDGLGVADEGAHVHVFRSSFGAAELRGTGADLLGEFGLGVTFPLPLLGKLHAHHARLTVHGRELLCRAVVEGRLSLCEAAAERGLSRQAAAKWVRRYRERGVAGLRDRSSRPHRLRQETSPDLVAQVEALRRERWTGHRIARQSGLSRATVSRILHRLKLSRIRDLEPRPPVQRYEHARPGDLLHLDIKRLVRIARPSHRVTGDRRDTVRGIGAESVHVAIDDHTRIAFSAIYPDETGASVLHFLDAALAYYARLGIHFRAVLTDNGAAYRSYAFARACKNLGLKHRRTRPYTPRTNGKAERFIQTALREWAYGRKYQTQPNGTKSCNLGCINTTGIDPMLASACRHPSAVPVSMSTSSRHNSRYGNMNSHSSSVTSLEYPRRSLPIPHAEHQIRPSKEPN